jgi:hypothetical protein
MGTTKKVKTKQKKENELSKPLTKQEIKKRLLRLNYYKDHPDEVYEKIWEFISKWPGWSDEERLNLLENIKKVNNFTNNHIPLVETQSESVIRTTIVELTNNIIDEYSCDTTAEKSLCEIVANSYWKVMQLSKKYTNVMIAGEYLSDERTRYLAMLWKELDRANRHYFTSLNMLIEMKKPQMNINVKTKNAYFSQNQQINNNKPKDENIKH